MTSGRGLQAPSYPQQLSYSPARSEMKGLNPVRMRSEFNSPLPSMDAHLLTKVWIPNVRRGMALSETFIRAWIMLTGSGVSIIFWFQSLTQLIWEVGWQTWSWYRTPETKGFPLSCLQDYMTIEAGFWGSWCMLTCLPPFFGSNPEK